jgi:hypothetical protein
VAHKKKSLFEHLQDRINPLVIWKARL